MTTNSETTAVSRACFTAGGQLLFCAAVTLQPVRHGLYSLAANPAPEANIKLFLGQYISFEGLVFVQHSSRCTKLGQDSVSC